RRTCGSRPKIRASSVTTIASNAINSLIAMRTALLLAGLFHSDSDYVPFGTRWLRGLTPARVGLLVAFCAVFSVRQNNFVSGPLLESFQYLAVQVFCYVPMLLLVTMADNITFGASNRRRVA